MRSLILASLLPLALGCPGDDSTDTDAQVDTGQTSSSTGETTPGTTTDDTTTPTTTTTGMEGSSTAAMDGSSTSGSMDGSSTSGGMETTGGASEACVMFCADYFAVCGDNAGNDYGDVAGCEAACSGFDQAGFDCRRMHAMLAQGDADTHCPHASADGGGVC